VIVQRGEWGGPVTPAGHETAGAKRLVVIHHSYRPHRECGVALEREKADVRGMHRYHADQGWGGIGYNWLAFQSGNVYEGRGWGRVGAHTAGQNSASVGICLVIDGDVHAPTDAAIAAVEAIIAEGVLLGHIAPDHRRAPHSEFTAKTCPGAKVKATSLLSRSVQVPATGRDAIAAQPTLRRGKGGATGTPDDREAVLELQQRLDMPAEHRTGYFGTITESMVRTFQRRHGLTADGIVGPATWRALLGA
jgi:N-acetylmuramoyl-L-alanine amidase